MGNIEPQPPVSVVTDDPKRPWKAIIAATSAGIAAAMAYADQIPTWVVIILAVALAAMATYQVPNPKEIDSE